MQIRALNSFEVQQPRKVQSADRGGAVFDAEYPEDLPDIDAAQMLADLKAGKVIKGEGKGAAAFDAENAAEVLRTRMNNIK